VSQGIPIANPMDRDEEETWDTVGGAVESSISPPRTTREVIPESQQQAASADNSHASAEEKRPDPSTAMGVEQP
jgi:hypothetical protein